MRRIWCSTGPIFSNRPWILTGHQLSPDQIAGLCRAGPIAFMGASELGALASVFDAPPPVATPGYVRLEGAARAAGCRIVAFAP